ncbi:MAG: hypothetical protein HYX63_09585 [Gammaproteobacteria bacterium]|nr:hypothetical protein [Gammaproteobacteria bacterium]
MLTVMASPFARGVTLSLAAVIFSGAAGFAAGNGELRRASGNGTPARGLTTGARQTETKNIAELDGVYETFDDVVKLHPQGAVARLRMPHLL